jgi:uncharacterized membrane protein YedE/YeeE
MRLAVAFVIGAVFGLALSWSGMTDPDVLHDGLLFRDAYLMLFFASALGTAFIGLRLLRVRGARSVIGREPLTWTRVKPQPRHVYGGIVFGIGWALASACPGPVAAQVGQGAVWSLATAAGIALGILAVLRRTA